MKNSITLSEFNIKIKKNLQENFPERYYIVAEISEVNESRGHAYLELIEKDKDEKLLAKARATVWARTYRMLKPYFETSTGHSFEAGLKVLIVVTVEFHEVYGYSLNIKDIDPNYTVGDIERKRLIIIKRLEDEGVLDLNKELKIPLVPQKIAVISSESAAGYDDFINQLKNNDYGFKFYTKLFPAAMQGEETETTIINALEKIFEFEEIFDLVVIIRGGGSKSDLSWYDSYQLAINVSQFSLPIVTGIGHERDKSIIDIVANLSLKTPTAVAEFIIGHVTEYYSYLNQLSENFTYMIKNILSEKRNELSFLITSFKPIISEILFKYRTDLEFKKVDLKNNVKILLQEYTHFLNRYPENIKIEIDKIFSNEKQKNNLSKNNLSNIVNKNLLAQRHIIEKFEQKNKLLSPYNILKRGYSITQHNNKNIKSIKDIKKDDLIKTITIDGSFKSKVEN